MLPVYIGYVPLTRAIGEKFSTCQQNSHAAYIFDKTRLTKVTLNCSSFYLNVTQWPVYSLPHVPLSRIFQDGLTLILLVTNLGNTL